MKKGEMVRLHCVPLQVSCLQMLASSATALQLPDPMTGAKDALKRVSCIQWPVGTCKTFITHSGVHTMP